MRSIPRDGRSRAVRALCVVGVTALLVLPSAVQAQSATRKFGRGLAGMTTGFLEIPGNMVTESKARGWGYGLTLGFVRGLGAVVVRELVGVYEFVTAPFPVPAGYKPLIQPEFPWDHFD